MNILGLAINEFMSEILTQQDFKDLSAGVFSIVITLVIIKLSLRLGTVFIDKVFKVYIFSGVKVEERRTVTLSKLLKSVYTYTVYFIGIVSILPKIGIEIGPILAGAGILGLAVGFGAQNLVRDVITGFFIILEDQYSVGEYIETASVGGVVEEFGLRVTKLRDWNGVLHIVPNGRIEQVTNHNRGSMRALIDVGIAYEEDIGHALVVLERIAEETSSEYKDVIMEGPTVLGVQNLGESEVVLRMVAKTKPFEQWNIERKIRKKIKDAFDKEGIEIPYPRRVYIQPSKLESKANKVTEMAGE